MPLASRRRLQGEASTDTVSEHTHFTAFTLARKLHQPRLPVAPDIPYAHAQQKCQTLTTSIHP